MGQVISLRDIVEAMDSINDESVCYLDPETGKIVFVTENEAPYLEEDDESAVADLPQWQQESIAEARAVLAKNHLALPTKFDIDEWSIMRDFAEQQQPRVGTELLDSIHGPGAFRRFKHTIGRLGLVDQWYKFREEALQEIARDWLEEHHLLYK